MEREETVCKECQSREVEDVVMPCMEFTGGGGGGGSGGRSYSV